MLPARYARWRRFALDLARGCVRNVHIRVRGALQSASAMNSANAGASAATSRMGDEQALSEHR
jgi:hypothetical protein